MIDNLVILFCRFDDFIGISILCIGSINREKKEKHPVSWSGVRILSNMIFVHRFITPAMDVKRIIHTVYGRCITSTHSFILICYIWKHLHICSIMLHKGLHDLGVISTYIDVDLAHWPFCGTSNILYKWDAGHSACQGNDACWWRFSHQSYNTLIAMYIWPTRLKCNETLRYNIVSLFWLAVHRAKIINRILSLCYGISVHCSHGRACERFMPGHIVSYEQYMEYCFYIYSPRYDVSVHGHSFWTTE